MLRPSLLSFLFCLLTSGICQQSRLAVNIGNELENQRASTGSFEISSSPSPSALASPSPLSTLAPAPTQTAPTRGTAYTRLSDGENVVGTVQKGKSDYYRFGGSSMDFLLTLTPYNMGDADLYCLPATIGLLPDPINNVWSSDFSEGQDFIFISRNDSSYLMATNSSGISDFICAVFGWSDDGTQYRLVLDTASRARSLVPLERQALVDVYNRCCNQSTCGTWDLVSDSAAEAIYTDFCYFGANICDDEGYLIRLDLRRMGLHCDFPYEQVSVFSRLRKLSLQRNAIEGDIRLISQALENMTLLETIDISYNNLTGSLDSASSLCTLANQALRLLNLEFNWISGSMPACLLEADSQLREVLLAYNNIGGTIPDVVVASSRLDGLDLAFNNLSGVIPSSLGMAKQLATLSLSFNNLTGTLPASIGALPGLKSIRAAGNALGGKIPESYGLSDSLTDLSLNGNSFTSLPDVWYLPSPGVSKSLTFVDVGSNALSGPFPQALLLASNVIILYLDNNGLMGPLPEAPELFPNGRIFNVSMNRLNGSIPEGLASSAIFEGSKASQAAQRVRHVLDLSNNQFTGPTPTFAYRSNLPNTVTPSVYLGGNSFDCPIPAEAQYSPNMTCKAPAESSPSQAPASSTATPASLTTDSPYSATKSRHGHTSAGGLSGVAIFGIVVAGLAVAVLAGIGGFLLYRRYSRSGQGWRRESLQAASTFLNGNSRDVEIPPVRGI
eukprot:jgi/Botrbrau1/15746/Bobra.4_1s0114.1